MKRTPLTRRTPLKARKGLRKSVQNRGKQPNSKGMIKCKHLNCIVKEFALTCLEWQVVNGKLEDGGYADTAGPHCAEVICNDCGLDKVYHKNKPRWLKKYIQEFTSSAFYDR